MTNIYTQAEVLENSTKYFNGDDLAARVWLNKYALKDSAGNIYELNPDDMHHRIAKEIARIEKQYKNPITEEELFNLFKNFKYIVPQGSPMAGIGNDFQIGSLSNCFVIGNEGDSDSYGGIMKIDEEQVQLMKRRGGVGHDLSHIRPKSSPVKNSALTSTGLVPFMERYSNSTREVAQDGRRGALMLSVSIKHPDSENFIDAKMKEGKITGANVSVKITNDFMKSVINNEEFTQQYPIDSKAPKFSKNINAKLLWDKIVYNAWKSAEPGILFWDTIIKESVPDCYADLGFKTVSTNPCIIGDSLVAVADGRNAVSIRQLAEEGKDIPVYTKNIEGQIQIKWGRNPRLTGKKKEVWKLTLDDGSEFIATPDHNIYIKNNTYKQLKDLVIGESISSFYSFNSNRGYRQIAESGQKMIGGRFRNRRQYRLIYEFYNGIKTDYKLYNIHHKDFDNSNDNIENLELMTREEHKFLHSERIKGENNPYHKFTDEQKFKFASHPGESNPKYINVTNDELLKHGKKLYKENGILTKRMWQKYARENGLPQQFDSLFRFKSFSDFKNRIIDNHKVVNIEFYGYEDVYNITVDDNHNYIVINSNDDDKFIVSGGICVKNCGEIPLCPYDSCRLLAINLYGYVNNPFTKEATFDYDLFIKHLGYAQRIMDDIIDLEVEKIDKILDKINKDPETIEVKRTEINLWNNIRKKCIEGRRTGIGITAEGDMLASLGYVYGTEEATKFSVKLHKLIAIETYRASVNLSKERGPFTIYDFEREKNNPFIKRIKESDLALYEEMRIHGRRNIALLTIAPTGSVSIMTQTTSGIEPAFLISYKRRRKVNPNDKNVRIDFTDESGDTWEEYNVFHSKFLTWLTANGYDADQVRLMKEVELNTIIEKSPYYKATANDVDWVAKVKMQGAIQKWVDHSISVTVNVPNDVKEELIGEIYKTAWESGCKGITVYREGSRSGVLISDSKKDEKSIDKIIKSGNAPKRPKILPCDVMRFQNNKEKWIGFVGLLPPPIGNNEPYEIFTGLLDSFQVPTFVDKGWIKKVKNENGEHSRYDFLYVDKDGYEQEMKGLSRAFNREYWNTGKLISAVLRHGMPIPSAINLVDSLHIDKDDTIVSWKAGVKRMLKNYIKDTSEMSGQICPDCGGNRVKNESGCSLCSDCGWSKCS